MQLEGVGGAPRTRRRSGVVPQERRRSAAEAFLDDADAARGDSEAVAAALAEAAGGLSPAASTPRVGDAEQQQSPRDPSMAVHDSPRLLPQDGMYNAPSRAAVRRAGSVQFAPAAAPSSDHTSEELQTRAPAPAPA